MVASGKQRAQLPARVRSGWASAGRVANLAGRPAAIFSYKEFFTAKSKKPKKSKKKKKAGFFSRRKKLLNRCFLGGEIPAKFYC
jgi:hypothetical protein